MSCELKTTSQPTHSNLEVKKGNVASYNVKPETRNPKHVT